MAFGLTQNGSIFKYTDVCKWLKYKSTVFSDFRPEEKWIEIFGQKSLLFPPRPNNISISLFAFPYYVHSLAARTIKCQINVPSSPKVCARDNSKTADNFTITHRQCILGGTYSWCIKSEENWNKSEQFGLVQKLRISDQKFPFIFPQAKNLKIQSICILVIYMCRCTENLGHFNQGQKPWIEHFNQGCVIHPQNSTKINSKKW